MVLVVLFLPIAILTTGLVVDLGIAACAKKAVQLRVTWALWQGLRHWIGIVFRKA